MPQSEVRIIVVAPTSSDTWAPCRTRLYTSRPNSSVPRKFAALGAFRRSAGLSRRGDQDHALHDGIGAAQHRGDDQAPEPGNVEDDLGDHGAADQDRHRDPDDGDDRDERIAERVYPHDGPLRYTLRPRRPDVVLL